MINKEFAQYIDMKIIIERDENKGKASFNVDIYGTEDFEDFCGDPIEFQDKKEALIYLSNLITFYIKPMLKSL
jgi:hypothetical protein